MSDRQLADWREHALKLESEINKVVVGQESPIRLITKIGRASCRERV